MPYDGPGCWRYPMLMVFRLLYRVLAQSLDRGASAEPKDAAAAGRASSEIRGTHPRRRHVATLAVLLGAGAIAALVLAGLLPDALETTGDRAATLRLGIPEVGAKPLVVYLRGTDLDSAAPAAEASSLPRIRSVDGRFSPRFQVAAAASTIEMVNADSIAHNTHVFSRGETVFNVALPLPGVTVRKVLTGDGIFDVRCDMHPWMRAWVFVPPSRHYAVLGEPATIDFTGIAPGEYVLHDWQPDRPEGVRAVSMAAGETRHLRLRRDASPATPISGSATWVRRVAPSP